MNSRIGTDQSTWRYDALTSVKYAHAPFSGIPLLNKIYGTVGTIAGSKHTLRMSMFMHHNEKNGPFNAFAGSVMRMIVDIANDDYIEIAMDVGVSQDLTSKYRLDQIENYQEGKYFKLASYEGAGG